MKHKWMWILYAFAGVLLINFFGSLLYVFIPQITWKGITYDIDWKMLYYALMILSFAYSIPSSETKPEKKKNG